MRRLWWWRRRRSLTPENRAQIDQIVEQQMAAEGLVGGRHCVDVQGPAQRLQSTRIDNEPDFIGHGEGLARIGKFLSRGCSSRPS